MHQRLSELARDIQALRERTSVDAEIREQVQETLADVDGDWQRITREHAFRQFLHSFLLDERDRFQSGGRDDPLCTCGNPECSLKRGHLPGRVLTADDLIEGIYVHQEKHPEARVLLEARDEWSEMRARVRTHLREAKMVLEERRIEETTADEDETQQEVNHAKA